MNNQLKHLIFNYYLKSSQGRRCLYIFNTGTYGKLAANTLTHGKHNFIQFRQNEGVYSLPEIALQSKSALQFSVWIDHVCRLPGK